VFCGLVAGGCGQNFQNGTLYWSPATGVHPVSGVALSAWGGREAGPLGYPTTDYFCGLRDGGCAQGFQNGRIFTSPVGGTHALTAPIDGVWVAQGLERGTLGYPITDAFCGLTGGGCAQAFEGGRIFTTPSTGTHAVTGPIQDTWIGQGLERGPLGYPVTDAFCGLTGGGCGQAFQGGRVFTSPASGTHAVSGPIQDAWIAQGLERGTLGYPTGDLVCGLAGCRCKQDFQGGTVYTSGTGTLPVSGTIATAWQATGSEGGPLGYPITGVFCGLRDGGCGQAFQNGRVFTSPAGGTHAVSGPIQDAWIAQGLERGTLGYPTGEQACGLAGGGCKQDFQGGTLYTQPAAGTFAVSGATATAWQAAGGEGSLLGYPITGYICGLRDGGCVQAFQNGRVFTSPATGTHAVSGPIQDTWIAQGLERGSLGYPSGDLVCGLAGGGCKQTFQGGTLYTHPAAGTFLVSGAVRTAWQAAGGEGSTLGYPITGLMCGLRDGGCVQAFQGGRVFTSPATGTHAVSGPIQDTWIAQGLERGSLGYPTSDPYAVSGGTAQNFEGGKLILDASTGTVTRG